MEVERVKLSIGENELNSHAMRVDSANLEQLVAGGPQSVRVEVHEASDVGSARRAAARLSISSGLDEKAAGSLALVVTEAATNIALHGKDGVILLRTIANGVSQAVEMIAVDKGVGIPDMARAMSDGFSTGGTRGQGLSSIKRNSLGFDIWSSPGLGTALVARFSSGKVADERSWGAGVICRAIEGEVRCGDAWAVEESSNGQLVTIADGLGHGPDAAIAAGAALKAIRDRKSRGIADILSSAHGHLRATRGAAIQIAVIDRTAGTVRSMGVGNISTSISTATGSKGIPSQPGIVGHQQPNLREVALPFAEGALLIMHSDGISARWKLDSYPGLRLRDPALVAAMLYRDFARHRDDATIVVVRNEARTEATT